MSCPPCSLDVSSVDGSWLSRRTVTSVVPLQKPSLLDSRASLISVFSLTVKQPMTESFHPSQKYWKSFFILKSHSGNAEIQPR